MTLFSEEITCAKLNCSVHAECVTSRYGQPRCSCLEGYDGDGSICKIIPTNVKISGYAMAPDMVFDNTEEIDNVASVLDLGPVIQHNYHVKNMGPHTAGNLKVNIVWPLQVFS